MAVSEVSRAIAVAAFVASYVGLALGRVPGFRIDRTGVAIIGAAVMVASGAVPWADAVASVDAPTLVLLFGMMIVTAANVGSVATLTGNPQNMLVGSFSSISYRSFLAREAPIAVVGLVCVYVAVALVYRRRLPNAPLEIAPDTRLAVHYSLMWKTI